MPDVSSGWISFKLDWTWMYIRTKHIHGCSNHVHHLETCPWAHCCLHIFQCLSSCAFCVKYLYILALEFLEMPRVCGSLGSWRWCKVSRWTRTRFSRVSAAVSCFQTLVFRLRARFSADYSSGFLFAMEVYVRFSLRASSWTNVTESPHRSGSYFLKLQPVLSEVKMSDARVVFNFFSTVERSDDCQLVISVSAQWCI